jgi:metallo-beta-lactamase family protein
MRTAEVHFLGAAGTVTGSKHLVSTPEITFMVDCGMFQGLESLREQNWIDLPVDVKAIDYVLLTHGHLDHVGYLPRLIRQGFNGKILGTAPTLELAGVILKDSAKIQEEEAKSANEEGYSRHHPALPLYTVKEAERTLKLFNSIETEEWNQLSTHAKCRFRTNGHIIGSTYIEVDLFDKRFVFSGDVGRLHDHLLEPPNRPEWADYLFLESTYGDRLHPNESLTDKLTGLVMQTLAKRGVLIIPSFAVERLQVLMYLLWRLYRERRIPNIPIFVDSPMGNNVIEIFKRYPHWHKLDASEFAAVARRMTIVRSYRETWETIDDPRPKIVIAGSGMVTGGRVLTYLQQLLDVPTTDILLVGFQAEGTRGRLLLEGASQLRIYGKDYKVKAGVHHVESLSAHADQAELLNWVSAIRNVPEKTFLVHGEAEASSSLSAQIKARFNWPVTIPGLFSVEKLIV